MRWLCGVERHWLAHKGLPIERLKSIKSKEEKFFHEWLLRLKVHERRKSSWGGLCKSAFSASASFVCCGLFSFFLSVSLYFWMRIIVKRVQMSNWSPFKKVSRKEQLPTTITYFFVRLFFVALDIRVGHATNINGDKSECRPKIREWDNTYNGHINLSTQCD